MIRGDVGPSEPLGLFGFVSTIRETGGLQTVKVLSGKERKG